MAVTKHHVLRNGVSIGIGNIFLSFANLGRDAAIASSFGIALNVDAFFLALALPIFFTTVCTSAFRSTIVPLLEKITHATGGGLANLVAGRFLLINSFVVLGIAGFLALTAPIYAPIIAGKLPLPAVRSVVLFSWAALPMLMISGYATLIEGPLQTKGWFLMPAMVRIGLPVGISAGAIFLGPQYGIYGACIGGMVGASIQLLMSFFLLHKEQMLNLVRTPMDKKIALGARNQFFLLSAGMSIVYISPVIDQWMASFLSVGSVSTLSYANRLAVGVSLLTTGSLGPALLPYFSRKAAQGITASLNESYVTFVRLSIWAGVGLSGCVWLVSEPVVVFLFEGGSFTHSDSLNVANVLGWFCLQYTPLLVSTAGFTLISAVSLNRFFIPMSILNAFVNVSGNLILMRYYDVSGIAIATGVTYFVSLLTMNILLHKKKIIRLPYRVVQDVTFSVGIASVLGFALVYLEGKPQSIPTIQQIIVSCGGISVYCLTAYFFTKPLLKGLKNIRQN